MDDEAGGSGVVLRAEGGAVAPTQQAAQALQVDALTVKSESDSETVLYCTDAE